MFVPFLIMLREGLEAALIVSLIASYLKRTQRSQWFPAMWIGVFAAALLLAGLSIKPPVNFRRNSRSCLRVSSRWWCLPRWCSGCVMRKVSRNVEAQLEDAVDSAM